MKILLVEDYGPLRQSLKQGLTEQGFVVDASGDGEEGLWFATSGTYDVIVLDLMLPGMDGLEVLARLRKAQHPAHVLILTAMDAVDDRVRGLDMGADDYLVKPFEFHELLARIRALIRRKYDQKSPLITVGDLEIDTVARKVRRLGDVVRLSHREYVILEILARRAGRVVTRREIWDMAYDFADDAGSNVIDVTVGRLRRKLESGGGSRHIHTRRGFGYVLGDDS